MTLQTERCGDLNLVIHARQLRLGILEETITRNNPKYLAQMQQALNAINDISLLPNTVFVDHKDPNLISEDIGNAMNIMIFGCTRAYCVEWAAEAALAAGAIVAISIKGTV